MFDKESKMNTAGLQELAKSGDMKKLMTLLQKNGAVGDAAKSASKGDATALLGMLQQLMSTEEGAGLIETIQEKAKKAGIDK